MALLSPLEQNQQINSSSQQQFNKEENNELDFSTQKERFEYLNLSAIQFYTGLIFDELPDEYFNDPHYDDKHPENRPLINKIIEKMEEEIELIEKENPFSS